MKCGKENNEEQENYRVSKSGCWIAIVTLLLISVFIMGGLGVFDGIPQWFANITDPAPEGREALIWRYFKGLETGEYNEWEYVYDDEGNVTKNGNGILFGMHQRPEWKEKLRDSHRYYTRECGDEFSITYEIDDVEPMDDEQIKAFNEYFMDQYFDNYDFEHYISYEYDDQGVSYVVVTDRAWIYELYIEIEGEDDDISYKSNYVIYEIDGRLYIEPMDFK